jgi:ribosome-binding protein aMBF1 (putative translation factor)
MRQRVAARTVRHEPPDQPAFAWKGAVLMPRRPRNAEDDASFQGLGLAVRALREERGWSPGELAEKIEDDLSIIERIERGTVDADWATLRVLATALNLPLPDLIAQAEQMAPGHGGDQWRAHSRRTD